MGTGQQRDTASIVSWRLGASFLSAACAFGFVRIAGEMLEGDTRAFDQAILLALRHPNDLATPIGPAWLETAMRDLTSLGSVSVLTLISAIAIGFMVVSGKRLSALTLVVVIGGGALIDPMLKWGFGRPRPDLVSHLVAVQTNSFPSGHSMLSAVAYFSLAAVLGQLSDSRSARAYLFAIAVLLTLVIGISRVYLGVHWPTDVIAGWCAGSAWVLLCWLVAGRVLPDRQGQPSP